MHPNSIVPNDEGYNRRHSFNPIMPHITLQWFFGADEKYREQKEGIGFRQDIDWQQWILRI